MNITLPPELEQFIADKVSRGEARTPDELICEGLVLVRKKDEWRQKQDELRQLIAEGIESADRGELAPFSARETLAKIRQPKEQVGPRTE